MWFDRLLKKAGTGEERHPLCGDDREQILELLQKMSHETVKALEMAMKSLVDRNESLAMEVIAGDDVVDRLEVEVEQVCLRFIAMRQPVRDDLRFVFTVLKIITDLERTADQAVNIAQRACKLGKEELFKPLVDIPEMGEICAGMLGDALESFVNADAALARDVFRRDDLVDRLNHRVFEEIMGLMAGNPQRDDAYLRKATDLILTSRYLERIGDHASNIAERSFFMITGNRIKEDWPKGESDIPEQS